MRPTRVALGVTALMLSHGAWHLSSAQVALAPVLQGSTQPLLKLWSFGSGVRSSGGTHIKSASQLAIPLGGRVDFASGTVTLSADGAILRASVTETTSEGASIEHSLTGLTDLRARLVWRLAGDRLAVTAGANLPIGTAKLDERQSRVLQVVGAPALEASVPVLGVGAAATVGVIAATRRSGWAWAAGAAFERRAQYTPLDRAALGGGSGFDLNPGDAVHLSAGGDGLAGPHRVSLSASLVLYTEDQISLGSSGIVDSDATTTTYQLGPLFTAGASWMVASPRFRELTVGASLRHRGAFQGDDGTSVAGSSGQYADMRLLGVLGIPGRTGIVLGADLLYQTGLPVDDGILGAGLTGIAGTFGLDFSGERTAFRPTVRVMVGSLRAASGSVNLVSFGIGGVLHAR